MKVEHSVVPVSLPVEPEKESPSHPPELQPDTSEPPSRVDLLLSPQQLIDEGFPLPIANSEYGVMCTSIYSSWWGPRNDTAICKWEHDIFGDCHEPK